MLLGKKMDNLFDIIELGEGEVDRLDG